MNENIAIKVTNLSKHYKLYNNHIDRFKEALNPFNKTYHTVYKALDNIDFEIKKGEAVGIIGRNGAGKSTLLKIITGVLTQTRGEVQVNGRIASLLELGAGFNPELTGYENIYFNASLLGLSDDEIESKIDSILSFADIGEYIYQPVKTYSSGMFVRLAFAVISHVDADILIIDEALAVGDALFVQKCMSFIRNFIKNKTLLFVSHDNSAVIDLCHKAIYLKNGSIKKEGVAKDVCKEYVYDTLETSYGNSINLSKESKSTNDKNSLKNTNDPNNKIIIKTNLEDTDSLKSGFGEIEIFNINHVESKATHIFQAGDEVILKIVANVSKEIKNPILGFIVKDSLGRELFGENTYEKIKDNDYYVYPNEKLYATFRFNLPMLQNGEYVIMASLASGDPYNHVHHHYVHEGIILNVLHEKLVFGIMSIAFHEVKLYKK